MNTNELDKIYIGSNEVTKLYLGSDVVWEGIPEPVGPYTYRSVPVDEPTNTIGYGYGEGLPANFETGSNFPLIIYFHASTQEGWGTEEDLEKLTVAGLPMMCDNGTWAPGHNFVMLAPQMMLGEEFHNPAKVNALIKHAVDNLKVDATRVYLTGISLGAWSCWIYLDMTEELSRVTAVVPLSGPIGTGYALPETVAASNIPAWLISDIEDPSEPWNGTSPWGYNIVQTRDSINAINPGQVKLTGLHGDDHWGNWNRIYDSSATGEGDPLYDPFDTTIYDWMLSHTRAALPVSPIPTPITEELLYKADVGRDIPLPIGFINSGSYDVIAKSLHYNYGYQIWDESAPVMVGAPYFNNQLYISIFFKYLDTNSQVSELGSCMLLVTNPISLPTPITTEETYTFLVGQVEPAMLEVTNLPADTDIEWYALAPSPDGVSLGNTNPVQFNPEYLADPIVVAGYVRFVKGIEASEWAPFTIEVV